MSAGCQCYMSASYTPHCYPGDGRPGQPVLPASNAAEGRVEDPGSDVEGWASGARASGGGPSGAAGLERV